MESIEFERVSIESLKALQGEERKQQEGRAAQDANVLRSPVSPAESGLSEQATAWLNSLPEAVRPTKLATSYPRIVNRLCQCWRRPVEADRYFDDLMTDKRGGRQGFPLGVALELASLSDYYRSEVFPVRKTAWDDQLSA